MIKDMAKYPSGISRAEVTLGELYVEKKWIDPFSTTCLGRELAHGWKTGADLQETDTWRLSASHSHCSGKQFCINYIAQITEKSNPKTQYI